MAATRQVGEVIGELQHGAEHAARLMSAVSARLDAESDAASGIGQHTHHVVDGRRQPGCRPTRRHRRQPDDANGRSAAAGNGAFSGELMQWPVTSGLILLLPAFGNAYGMISGVRPCNQSSLMLSPHQQGRMYGITASRMNLPYLLSCLELRMLQKLENIYLNILRFVVILVASILLVVVAFTGINALLAMRLEPVPKDIVPKVPAQSLVDELTHSEAVSTLVSRPPPCSPPRKSIPIRPTMSGRPKQLASSLKRLARAGKADLQQITQIVKKPSRRSGTKKTDGGLCPGIC